MFAYIKLLALSLVQDSIIFNPNPRGTHPIMQPADYGLKDTEDKTLLTEDGETIHYWIRKPSNPEKPYIVFFHGNSGHLGDLKSLTETNNDRGYRSKFLDDFAAEGYGFIAVSQRGYGKSTGKPSEEGFVKDVSAVADLIQKENFQVVIFGESLGAFAALTLMDKLNKKNIDPKGVALMAPFSDLVEKAYESHPDFRRFDVTKYLKYRFDNRKIIRETKYRGRILFIHPLEDEVSGVYHTKILQGEAEKNGIETEIIIIKDAGHVDWKPAEVAKMVTERF